MLPEQVDQMLKNYKAYKGRCAHLQILIKEAERNLDTVKSNVVDAAAYHVQDYSAMDMPKGSGVGNPTERLGIWLASGAVGEALQDHRDMINRMRQEYTEKMLTVKFVEAWLSGLTEKERWLIEQQVIEGKYWREITLAWGRKFGETLSRDWIRKLKSMALQKLYSLAS